MFNTQHALRGTASILIRKALLTFFCRENECSSSLSYITYLEMQEFILDYDKL